LRNLSGGLGVNYFGPEKAKRNALWGMGKKEKFPVKKVVNHHGEGLLKTCCGGRKKRVKTTGGGRGQENKQKRLKLPGT